MYSGNEISARIGFIGEEKVAEFLSQKGYIILKRNWRDRYGEVDIIAENDENIVFVEVKTRNECSIVSAGEAVDEHKKTLIRNTAESFTNKLNTHLPPRIDVAEVTYSDKADGTKSWKLKYIKSAF